MSSLAEAQRAAGTEGHDEPPPDEPSFIKLLRKIDGAFARVEEILLLVFIAVLMLVGIYAVIARKLFEGQPEYTAWTFEVIRYTVFFIGLTGAALATQGDRLFNIDSFTRLFTPRGRLIVRIVTALFTIAVCVLFLRASLALRGAVADERSEVIKPALGVLALPTAFATIMAHIALHVVIDLVYLVRGRIPAELTHAQVPKA
ncbi:MAG TPA: TRAP transporter small permease [Haliangiales bacterium]|nr:TRAP transporter small permease [Haliangiales bacterium]